jgi:hypothetical protein
MPLKFKIYYACSLYLLLWAGGIFSYGLYSMLTDTSHDNTLPQYFALFILTLIVYNAASSMVAVRRYRKSKMPSKVGRVLLIIGFAFNCLLSLAILALLIFVVVPDDFFRITDTSQYGLSSTTVFLQDVSIFLADVCAIQLAATGLALLKATNKKYNDNLLSFEIDNDE